MDTTSFIDGFGEGMTTGDWMETVGGFISQATGDI